MKKLTLFLSFILVFRICHGQDTLKSNTTFIGGQFLGPAWFASLSIGKIIHNRLQIEIGGGLVGYQIVF